MAAMTSLEGGRGGGLLPYIDYTGMCHCIVYRAGYGSQTFLSRTGHRKHNLLDQEQCVKFKQV